MSRITHQFTRRRQSGTTLIEVLITVLVMSIGLLGLAALQGFSLQSSQAAYYRTQATNVAYEIADFSRLNRSDALSSCTLTDLDFWEGFVANQLPGGQIDAEVSDCDVGEITVKVSWAEERLEDADGGEEVEITTRI